MTCEHQWHDATTSAGPEWVCAKCKVNYSEIKKTLSAPKRGWVGLTDEELSGIYNQTDWNVNGDWNYERAIEAKLRSKNT
jgi:hypothetical protein